MIELKKLNYDFGDLEPYIDAQTVEIHHTKHHQAYVNNLNGLIKGTNLENLNLDEILLQVDSLDSSIKNGVNNNAGGVYLHDNYFGQFSKNPSVLTGELKEKIDAKFGSFDQFLEKFKTKAATQFGSGWSALVVNKNSKDIDVVQIPNQDVAKFLKEGNIPIATLDVWEHAYYLKYQNLRPKYLDEVVNLIDWDIVTNRYLEIIK